MSNPKSYAQKLNLLLCSDESNFLLELVPILEQMWGDKLDDKKIVLIPNGGIGEGRASMTQNCIEQFCINNNAYIKILDLEKTTKAKALDTLNSCDIIMIHGGYVSRIINAIDNLGIRNELLELINTGKPYIGFSSGSMVASTTTTVAETYPGEPDPDLAGLKPLGLVNFEIFPHFQDSMLEEVTKLAKDVKEAYAIRNTDALVVTNRQLLKVGNPVKFNSTTPNNAKTSA